MKRKPAPPAPPAVVVPPILEQWADLDKGRRIIAISTKPGIWDWCGPLEGVRQVHDKMAKLGIRYAQMKLPDGAYALIGWWTPDQQQPKRRRF